MVVIQRIQPGCKVVLFSLAWPPDAATVGQGTGTITAAFALTIQWVAIDRRTADGNRLVAPSADLSML
ncbi:hypothetical protein D3C79_979670 [compost metagenome]